MSLRCETLPAVPAQPRTVLILPAMVAAKAQTTHTSLRSMQHKDSQGNPIGTWFGI